MRRMDQKKNRNQTGSFLVLAPGFSDLFPSPAHLTTAAQVSQLQLLEYHQKQLWDHPTEKFSGKRRKGRWNTVKKKNES